MSVWGEPKPTKEQADRDSTVDLANMLGREAFQRAMILRSKPVEQAYVAGRAAVLSLYVIAETVAKVDADHGGIQPMQTGRALNHIVLATDALGEALRLNPDAFTGTERWAMRVCVRILRGVVAKTWLRATRGKS